MALIFLAVTQKVTMELLEMVFGDVYISKRMENHFHRLGVTSDLLLITTIEFLDFKLGESFLNLPIGQLATFNSSR